MMLLKLIITTLASLLLLPVFSQESFHYEFIPENLIALSNEAANNAQIIITPDVMLFTENGERLPMSQMRLMADPEYRPLFYTNHSQEIKAVVFQKKSNHPILIEKNPEASYNKGEKALDFIGYQLDGTAIKLSNYKDKIVVLNFWFTTCGPCVQEIPQLNALVDEFSDKNVVFLALTFNKKNEVQSFLQKNTFNYNILHNANDIITMYGIQTYPTSIVINQKGEIMFKELGYRLNIKDVLSNEIHALL